MEVQEAASVKGVTQVVNPKNKKNASKADESSDEF